MKQFRDLIVRKRPATVEQAAGLAEDDADLVPDFAEIAARIAAEKEALPDIARRDELASERLRATQPVPAPLPEPVAAPLQSRPNIWDLEADEPEAAATPPATDAADGEVPQPAMAHRAGAEIAALAAAPPAPPAAPAVPAADAALRRRRVLAPAAGAPAPAPAAAPSSRAKTRILGFHGGDLEPDAMAAPRVEQAAPARYPAGWIVVLEGPGRGASFTLLAGVSTIGRGTDQTISLDYGDTAISRENHASIAYDEEQNRFFIGHGGKSNIVRRNGNPVLATEEMHDGDLIRIGKTTLRFIGLCGPEFTWATDGTDGDGDAPER